MNNHLNQFNGQAVAIVSQEKYQHYFEGRPDIGHPPDKNDLHGSMYVTTPDALNAKIAESNGDVSKLESSLGLDQGTLGDNPIIVGINNPENHGLRMANGQEAGANEFYNTKLDENGNLPNIQYADDRKKAIDVDKTDPEELGKLNGQYWDNHGLYHVPNANGYDGCTSGGMPEAVVNQVANTPENISYTQLDGFKRGENSEISRTPILDSHYTPPAQEANNADMSCLYNYSEAKELPKQNDVDMNCLYSNSGNNTTNDVGSGLVNSGLNNYGGLQ